MRTIFQWNDLEVVYEICFNFRYHYQHMVRKKCSVLKRFTSCFIHHSHTNYNSFLHFISSLHTYWWECMSNETTLKTRLRINSLSMQRASPSTYRIKKWEIIWYISVIAMDGKKNAYSVCILTLLKQLYAVQFNFRSPANKNWLFVWI